MENMFAKNIKYLIDSGKIDVKTILKITNHNSKSLISMWRTGERYIITEDAVKLANYLGITVDDLLNHSLKELNEQFDDFDEYFMLHKHLLNDDDKSTIRFIIDKRVKENE